jgi:hypothetical protein
VLPEAFARQIGVQLTLDGREQAVWGQLVRAHDDACDTFYSTRSDCLIDCCRLHPRTGWAPTTSVATFRFSNPVASAVNVTRQRGVASQKITPWQQPPWIVNLVCQATAVVAPAVGMWVTAERLSKLCVSRAAYPRPPWRAVDAAVCVCHRSMSVQPEDAAASTWSTSTCSGRGRDCKATCSTVSVQPSSNVSTVLARQMAMRRWSVRIWPLAN